MLISFYQQFQNSDGLPVLNASTSTSTSAGTRSSGSGNIRKVVEEVVLGRPSLKGTVFDRILGPKNGPEDLQLNLVFLCRVCDTWQARRRAAESIPKIWPRLQQSGFGALDIDTRVKNAAHIVLFIVNSASPNNRTGWAKSRKCALRHSGRDRAERF